MVNLELINEGIGNAIEELEEVYKGVGECTKKYKTCKLNNLLFQLRAAINDLNTYNDQIYRAFEEQPDYDKSEEDWENFKALLDNEIKPRLSWRDKIDIKIRYGIDLT